MVISKVWLEQKIKESDNNTDRKLAFQECFNELVKSPKTKSKEKIDHNKGYESILQYYIKKGYTKEHANEIAMKSIENQKQKVL